VQVQGGSEIDNACYKVCVMLLSADV